MKKQEEQLAIRQEVRNFVEEDYDKIEDYLVKNYDNLKKFLDYEKIKERREKAKREEAAKEKLISEEERAKEIKKNVRQLLNRMGASAAINGYHYIQEAVLIYCSIENYDSILITKDIYPEIANVFNTSWTAVERSIRRMIEKVNLKVLEQYGYELKSPKLKNSEFLIILTKIIKEYYIGDELVQYENNPKPKKTIVKLIFVEEEQSKDDIAKYLQKMAIPTNVRGYRFLEEGISLYMQNEEIKFMKELYPKIAKKFETVPISIERCIRHAIEAGFDRANPDDIEEIFGYTILEDKGKPTNSEFIARIAVKVKNQI